MARKPPKELVLTDRNPYTECTIQQRQYIEARLQGLTKAAAARAAGVTNPSQLEKSPKVSAAIRYLLQQNTKNVEELTKSDVLTGMMDAVAASSTAAELVMAWREVGKLLGAYEPERKILEIHDYSKDDLRALPDEELVRLAGSRMKGAVDVDEADYKDITPRSSKEPAELDSVAED